MLATSRIVLVAISSVSLVGCLGTEEDAEPIESVQSAVGLHCDTSPADRTFIGKIDPRHVSPRTYGSVAGHNSCFQTYVVDLMNIQAAYTGQGKERDAQISVTWADSLPASPISRATCESLRGEVAFFRRQGSTWVQQGSTKVRNGRWVSIGPFPGCEKPYFTILGMQPGDSYRIAATYLQGGALGTMRSLGIQTQRPLTIQ